MTKPPVVHQQAKPGSLDSFFVRRPEPHGPNITVAVHRPPVQTRFPAPAPAIPREASAVPSSSFVPRYVPSRESSEPPLKMTKLHDGRIEEDKAKKKISVYTKRGRPSVSAIGVEKEWKCGCGKEYLTYGALYSHTRLHHGGVQPPGSVRLRDENRKPRVTAADPERCRHHQVCPHDQRRQQATRPKQLRPQVGSRPDPVPEPSGLRPRHRGSLTSSRLKRTPTSSSRSTTAKTRPAASWTNTASSRSASSSSTTNSQKSSTTASARTCASVWSTSKKPTTSPSAR